MKTLTLLCVSLLQVCVGGLPIFVTKALKHPALLHQQRQRRREPRGEHYTLISSLTCLQEREHAHDTFGAMACMHAVSQHPESSLCMLCSTAGRLQKQATKGWQQAREATVSGYKKLTGGPLAVCRLHLSVSLCILAQQAALRCPVIILT